MKQQKHTNGMVTAFLIGIFSSSRYFHHELWSLQKAFNFQKTRLDDKFVRIENKVLKSPVF